MVSYQADYILVVQTVDRMPKMREFIPLDHLDSLLEAANLLGPQCLIVLYLKVYLVPNVTFQEIKIKIFFEQLAMPQLL